LKNSRLVQRWDAVRQEHRVAVLPAAHEKAPKCRYRALAGETRIDLVAGSARAGRELEGVVTSIGAKLDEPSREMECVLPLTLQLHMLGCALVADPDLGCRIALKSAEAKAAKALPAWLNFRAPPPRRSW
jgi:hypothetical protein